MSEVPVARPEGVEEYRHFRDRQELEQFVVDYGIKPEIPKRILYAFKSGFTDFLWEDKQQRDITDPCTVTDLLERLGDINTFFADEPNDFTVGLVLRLEDDRQLAVRYILEECELVDPPGSDNTVDDSHLEREFDYISQYEAAICRDHKQLCWHGRSLVEF